MGRFRIFVFGVVGGFRGCCLLIFGFMCDCRIFYLIYCCLEKILE